MDPSIFEQTVTDSTIKSSKGQILPNCFPDNLTCLLTRLCLAVWRWHWLWCDIVACDHIQSGKKWTVIKYHSAPASRQPTMLGRTAQPWEENLICSGVEVQMRYCNCIQGYRGTVMWDKAQCTGRRGRCGLVDETNYAEMCRGVSSHTSLPPIRSPKVFLSHFLFLSLWKIFHCLWFWSLGR